MSGNLYVYLVMFLLCTSALGLGFKVKNENIEYIDIEGRKVPLKEIFKDKNRQRERDEFRDKFQISIGQFLYSRKSFSGVTDVELVSFIGLINDYPNETRLVVGDISNSCDGMEERVGRDDDSTRRRGDDRITRETCTNYVDKNILVVADANLRDAFTALSSEEEKLRKIESAYTKIFLESEEPRFLTSVEYLDINGDSKKENVECSVPFVSEKNISTFITKYKNGADISIENLDSLIFQETRGDHVRSLEFCSRERNFYKILDEMLKLSKNESQLLSIIGKEYVCFNNDQNRITLSDLEGLKKLTGLYAKESPVLSDSLNSYFDMMKNRIVNNETLFVEIEGEPAYNSWVKFYNLYKSSCDKKDLRAQDYEIVLNALKNQSYSDACESKDNPPLRSGCRIQFVVDAIPWLKDYVLQTKVIENSKGNVSQKSSQLECVKKMRDSYCRTVTDGTNWSSVVNRWNNNLCPI